MWQCSQCGEGIQDDFDVCWSCGTSKEGVLDPTFFDPESVSIPESAALKKVSDEEETASMVTVAEYCQVSEAYAMRWQLEAAGIPVFLADELTLGMNRPYATGGIKVQVAKQDAQRATKILEGFARAIEEKNTNETDAEEE